ncbi:flagellar hook-length control protein FliK [Paracoccus sphaerophysae]|uniref:flagellar hook-length control protein FliK n=1 Tax=Paracoccus sphaerophysae TaxID=690417 RepID=UPI0023573EF8|nr:flagellar hook-length control protein FliK [Paracoccus sphaerophysae]
MTLGLFSISIPLAGAGGAAGSVLRGPVGDVAQGSAVAFTDLLDAGAGDADGKGLLCAVDSPAGTSEPEETAGNQPGTGDDDQIEPESPGSPCMIDIALREASTDPVEVAADPQPWAPPAPIILMHALSTPSANAAATVTVEEPLRSDAPSHDDSRPALPGAQRALLRHISPPHPLDLKGGALPGAFGGLQAGRTGVDNPASADPTLSDPILPEAAGVGASDAVEPVGRLWKAPGVRDGVDTDSSAQGQAGLRRPGATGGTMVGELTVRGNARMAHIHDAPKDPSQWFHDPGRLPTQSGPRPEGPATSAWAPVADADLFPASSPPLSRDSKASPQSVPPATSAGALAPGNTAERTNSAAMPSVDRAPSPVILGADLTMPPRGGVAGRRDERSWSGGNSASGPIPPEQTPRHPRRDADVATGTPANAQGATEPVSGETIRMVPTSLTEAGQAAAPVDPALAAGPNDAPRGEVVIGRDDPALFRTHHRVEPHRQIADAIVRTRDGQVEILLDPVELGRVTVLLGMDDRSGLGIIAERPETLDLIRRHSDQLLRDLRDSGMPNASLDFMKHEGGGGRGGQSFPLPASAETARDRVEEEAAPLTSAAAPKPLGIHRIDIRL